MGWGHLKRVAGVLLPTCYLCQHRSQRLQVELIRVEREVLPGVPKCLSFQRVKVEEFLHLTSSPPCHENLFWGYCGLVYKQNLNKEYLLQPLKPSPQESDKTQGLGENICQLYI